MSKYRILYVTEDNFPSARADVWLLFGKFLPHFGIFSDVIAARRPGSDSSIKWQGGRKLDYWVPAQPTLKNVFVIFYALTKSLTTKSSQYLAIQVRDMPILALFILLIARMKRLQFYYWCSYPYPEGQIVRAQNIKSTTGILRALPLLIRGYLGKVLLYHVVMKCSDHVFVQSETMKAVMESRGVSSDKLTSVPMGVDMEDIHQKKPHVTCDGMLNEVRNDSGPKLVYLGALDYVRRIDILLEMLVLIVKEYPDTKLILVGDTVDKLHRSQLLEKAKSLNLEDNVIWTGWLPMDIAWQYVSVADIGLSPVPRSEALDMASPTKIIEYMALGLPVVANDNPDQRNVLEKSNAGVCVPYTAEDFSMAVQQLFKETRQQLELRKKNGVAYVTQNRDYRKLAEQLSETYKQLFQCALEEPPDVSLDNDLRRNLK
ncbi:MAG: glycosyltransferase family 4 protein [Pseudomonadales bacterium]|nr:glycosyltransferase family 4 protein [Pseudomonadales bacterium]